ncbi:MAG TPA: MFS transporter [Gemmataceae bacterium]|nr:MFS transporter [Gemmataceae bacterium]
MTMLQATTISAAFVFGMMLALLGSLKLALAKRLNLGEGQVGFLLAALNAAVIPLMLAAGLLIDLVGVRIILIDGSLATAAAVATLGMRKTFGRAFGSLLLAGLGCAAVNMAAILLMPRAFFGVDRLASASIDLGCVFMALGALVTPMLSDVLVRLVEFRRTAVVLAVVCLTPAVLAAWPGQSWDLPRQTIDLGELLLNGNLWLIGLLFLFYAPLESSLSVWATTYLTELGQTPAGATWALSGFWAAFLGSRLLAAMWLHWAAASVEVWLLIAAGALAAGVLGNLIGTGSRAAARFQLVSLGFLLGPVFPSLVGLIFHIEPAPPTGTAYGLVFALGSLGSLALAPLVGARARRSSFQGALAIPLALAGALTVTALVIVMTATLS